MSLDQLIEFFKWMTIINIAIFIFSVILTIGLKQLLSKMHSKMFGIQKEKVAVVVYGFFGVYKIAIIVLNIVPYIALLIIK